MKPWAAGALVFFVSGAVLVLEILAGRLLAPYVGLSLQTYTAIIGVVLGGISAGTWIGGRLADAFDPRRVLGPLLVIGGLLAIATLPSARHFGGVAEGNTWPALVLAVLLSFFLPAAALSAANPLVVKLQLNDLEETGRVVGRLSAIGTAGAIAGTFAAGFVLLPSFGTTEIVIVLGVCLALTGVGLALADDKRRRRVAAASVAAIAGMAVFAAGSESRCDEETAYFCASVTAFPQAPQRRVLQLDTLAHGIVDVRDAEFLGFPYARRIGDVVDVVAPPRRPIEALHVGGGAFSLPRYVAATRRGSSNLVLELDPGIVRIAKRHLGLRTGKRMRVRSGDARIRLDDLPSGTYDVVTGDAFAGVAVPWHLTTREAVTDIRRTLQPRGIYAMNLIDHGPLDFLKAELRTLQDVFRHVALVASPDLGRGVTGTSNFILLASKSRLPLGRLNLALDEQRAADVIVAGADLREFVGDATLLTDDYAPVDQLLTR